VVAKAADSVEVAVAAKRAVAKAADSVEVAGAEITEPVEIMARVEVEVEITARVEVEVETTAQAAGSEVVALVEEVKVLVPEALAKPVGATVSNPPKRDLGQLRTLNP
jgi:hypothetical protein